MKIKRFFSQDMRTVIRTVREELGPDAVILSNNRVNGGVEIIAAVDYDESLLGSDPKKIVDDKPETGRTRRASKTISESNKPLPVELVEKNNNQLEPSKPSSSFNIDEISKELAILGGSNKATTPAQQQPAQSKQQDRSDQVNFYQNNEYQGQSERQFYMLDESESGSDGMAKPREDIPNSTGENADNVWSQEPTLISMRNEITTLRGLLEQQLSGIAWGETERRNPIRAKLIRQLLELDLSPMMARKIADQQFDSPDYQSAWHSALTYMTDSLPVNDEDLIISGGVIALVGPTGAGKTTSMVKLASRYALRFGRRNIGLITIDNYRVGAHEQLKTYSKIFDIPLRVATNKENLVDCIRSMSDKHLILIDTAGLSHRDVRTNAQLSLLQDCSPKLKTLLVMPVTNHRTVLEETVVVYKKANLSGCILTKLDETTTLGGAVSVLLSFKLPVSYYCDGQKVPDTIHIATAHSLINRSVLIARKTNQPLGKESIERAFTGFHANAHI